MPVVPGVTLGNRYRIERKLGEGGFGSVHAATDLRLGSRCAVKTLSFANVPPQERASHVAQAEREARIAASLTHPNLVRVTDFFTEGGDVHMVMDLVDGVPLSLLSGRATPLDGVLAIASQLMDALEHLHSQRPPIIHRDLKPNNVMLAPSGHITLVDFGISRQLLPNSGTHTVIRGAGTEGFSPLEQYGAGGTTDTRSDIYSLGATLYFLLSGAAPPEVVARVASRTPLPDPQRINPTVTPEVWTTLQRMLAVEQDGRPGSIAECRQLLLAGTRGGAAGAAATPVASPRPAASVAPTVVSQAKPQGAQAPPPAAASNNQTGQRGIFDFNNRSLAWWACYLAWGLACGLLLQSLKLNSFAMIGIWICSFPGWYLEI